MTQTIDIAMLSARARAASSRFKERLVSAAAELERRRDALVRKAASLKDMAAGEWSAAKAELDVSLDELREEHEDAMAGIN